MSYASIKRRLVDLRSSQLSKYLLFQEGPIALASLEVLPRRPHPKSLRRRPPGTGVSQGHAFNLHSQAPITQDFIQQVFGGLTTDLNHPFFPQDPKFKPKLDQVLQECILPEDDEILLLFDSTGSRKRLYMACSHSNSVWRM